jgi:hypothetical protein
MEVSIRLFEFSHAKLAIGARFRLLEQRLEIILFPMFRKLHSVARLARFPYAGMT